MDISDQSEIIAAVPVAAVFQGLWAMLSVVAGMVATVFLAVTFLAFLPLIVVVALILGPSQTLSGRQGWRPVPA